MPILVLFADHLRPTLAGMFGVVACFAIFYLATAFALGYGTTALGHGRAGIPRDPAGAILFLALGVIISGVLSDRHGMMPMLRWGFAGCVVAGLLLGPMLGAASLFVIWLWLALRAVRDGLRLRPARRLAARAVPGAACATPASR